MDIQFDINRAPRCGETLAVTHPGSLRNIPARGRSPREGGRALDHNRSQNLNKTAADLAQGWIPGC
jgi:hypothetical protein